MSTVTSTSGNTSVFGGLSFLNDLQSLLHGKGGLGKVVPALDIVEQLAGLVGELFPSAEAITTGVAEAATVGEALIAQGTASGETAGQ